MGGEVELELGRVAAAVVARWLTRNSAASCSKGVASHFVCRVMMALPPCSPTSVAKAVRASSSRSANAPTTEEIEHLCAPICVRKSRRSRNTSSSHCIMAQLKAPLSVFKVSSASFSAPRSRIGGAGSPDAFHLLPPWALLLVLPPCFSLRAIREADQW